MDQIHLPIQLYDLLFALTVVTEADTRVIRAWRTFGALLAAKCVPGGGFPRGDHTAVTRDRIMSRGPSLTGGLWERAGATLW